MCHSTDCVVCELLSMEMGKTTTFINLAETLDTSYILDVYLVWPSIRTKHAFYCPDNRSQSWYAQPDQSYWIKMSVKGSSTDLTYVFGYWNFATSSLPNNKIDVLLSSTWNESLSNIEALATVGNETYVVLAKNRYDIVSLGCPHIAAHRRVCIFICRNFVLISKQINKEVKKKNKKKSIYGDCISDGGVNSAKHWNQTYVFRVIGFLQNYTQECNVEYNSKSVETASLLALTLITNVEAAIGNTTSKANDYQTNSLDGFSYLGHKSLTDKLPNQANFFFTADKNGQFTRKKIYDDTGVTCIVKDSTHSIILTVDLSTEFIQANNDAIIDCIVFSQTDNCMSLFFLYSLRLLYQSSLIK
ncbi:hypothetical protein RFI_12726 [Reticulomyxa filosa]|uniref:Uncharacterized protein n=1 Tax=Reticulomyxa filosa TaxID=46433 RepID=X6NFC5_RETFI|nr:hypothetical protein RFI_12726 [Reticulomyxa filosa]|eukprot:ETO24429.1 hypothetical protein RFI_12726 [Reticulomyxa filosa]